MASENLSKKKFNKIVDTFKGAYLDDDNCQVIAEQNGDNCLRCFLNTKKGMCFVDVFYVFFIDEAIIIKVEQANMGE